MPRAAGILGEMGQRALLREGGKGVLYSCGAGSRAKWGESLRYGGNRRGRAVQAPVQNREWMSRVSRLYRWYRWLLDLVMSVMVCVSWKTTIGEESFCCGE